MSGAQLAIEDAIKVRLLELVRQNEALFHAKFPQWLDENFDLWARFEHQCHLIRRRGFEHYSARTVVHFLRHETALQQKGGPLKINNNVSPDLARLYVLLHPSAYAFFEFRAVKNKGTTLSVAGETACA